MNIYPPHERKVKLRAGTQVFSKCWPDQTYCIYLLIADGGTILYVGKSRNPFYRIGEHLRNPVFKGAWPRIARWCRADQVTQLEVQVIRACVRKGVAKYNVQRLGKGPHHLTRDQEKAKTI